VASVQTSFQGSADRPGLGPSGRAVLPAVLRPVSYFWVQYLRTWKADLGTSFVTPLLYLVSLGLGLGSLIGHGRSLASLGGVDYRSFVAPALLATTAMQVAIGRATYEVWGSCNPWSGAYRSMQASPITVPQILGGHLVWLTMRLAIASAAYLAVSAALGTVHSGEAAACVLVGPLLGLSFATPIAAYSVSARIDAPFTLIFRLLMMPLFLFSGTFFPISQLPVVLRDVAYVLPLWHGVQLCRSLYLGTFSWGTGTGHLAYLFGVALLGWLVARRTYQRRLSR
jgi:lipooligosaccharide transport system permease protein